MLLFKGCVKFLRAVNILSHTSGIICALFHTRATVINTQEK